MFSVVYPKFSDLEKDNAALCIHCNSFLVLSPFATFNNLKAFESKFCVTIRSVTTDGAHDSSFLKTLKAVNVHTQY